MAEPIRVRIRRLDPGLPLPGYASAGAAGFDLYCREETVVAPGQLALLSTGIAVGMPPGYMLLVTARSSTPGRKGLSVPHGVGIIDQDYCGDSDEIRCQFYNFTDQPVLVARGERLAQGILVPIVRVAWEEVASLEARARGGFGSTGG